MTENAPMNRLDRIAIVMLVVFAVLARLLPGARIIDDAYITFRYARNLAEGVGFVYNPGQRVLGTTTPLFALLMAGAGALAGVGAYPTLAVLASALADGATCALLYLLARRLLGSRLPGAVLGALWALAPMSVTFAIGGMETSVFILLMVLAFWLYIEGRPRGMAAAAALGVLTRPDALVWAGPLFLHQLWADWRAQRRIPWRTWLVFAAVLLPWALFGLAYFGSPVPRSAGVKALTYTLAPGETLVRMIQHFATPFFEYDALGAAGTAAGMVLYPVLFALGALKLTRGERGTGRALPVLAYPWLYAAIFAIANMLVFRWYLAPPLPVYFLGILAGAWTVAGGAAARLRRPPVQAAIFGAAAAVWLAFSLNAWTLHPDHGPDRPAPEMAFIKLELLYEQVGRTLAADYAVTAETVVAAGDIGAVGYYSGATIYDTIGLVTPEVVAYYPVDPALLVEKTNYAIPPAVVMDKLPDYVVVMESYVRLGLMQDEGFRAAYVLIETLDTALYESEGMLVFRRAS